MVRAYKPLHADFTFLLVPIMMLFMVLGRITMHMVYFGHFKVKCVLICAFINNITLEKVKE